MELHETHDDDRLEHVLLRVVAAAASKGDVSESSGVNQAIRAKEKKIGRPFPDEVEQLCLRLTPADWSLALSDKSMRLLDVDEMEWVDPLALDRQCGSVTADRSAEYFTFAAGAFGDPVCIQCVDGLAGKVCLFDHEGGGWVYFANGLSQWLDRLLDYDGMEYAYFSGEIERLDLRKQKAIHEYHRGLNPQLEWPARGLARLEFPFGDPIGYLHWDGAKLIPIRDAGDVTKIILRNGLESDLDSIVAAGKCRDLTIAKSSSDSFASLALLHTLELFTIYDVEMFDCSVVKSLPGLKQIYALRCRLENLRQLASAPALVRLRADSCQFNEDPWEALSTERPDIKKSR